MKTHASMPAISLIALTLPIATSSIGCTTNLDVSQYQGSLTAGVNGLFNNQLREVVKEIQREARTSTNPNGLPAVIEDVGFGYDNFDEVQQAHELGRSINLIYHSSGPNNAPEFLEKCKEHGITIDRLFLTDPTRTSCRDFPIPDNVKRVDVYFSTKEDFLTLMAPWARGNPEKFDTADPRIHIHYPATNHLDLPRYLKPQIRDMMLAPTMKELRDSSRKAMSYPSELQGKRILPRH